MRLQSALSMDQFQGIEDFGRLFRDKEEREERREERRSRRRKRKRRRRKKKSARLQRRLDKLDSGRGQRQRGRKRGGAGRGPSGPSKRRKVARRSGGGRALVRAQRHTEDMPFEEPSLEPAPWGPEEVLEPEILDAEFEDDFQEFLELEGMGAVARRWSPNVRMGPNFRIQAAQGYRAAVIELKPGLFIVAELPEHVARSEFGIAPLLAPLVMRAATRAIQKPPEKRLLPKLFKAARERQAQGGGQGGGQGRALLQRVFQPKGGQGRPLLPMLRRDQTQARPQRQLVPAPGSGHGHSALLPAPALGRWVDDADLAGLFGCDDDGECGG
jgi:hypothetical protein